MPSDLGQSDATDDQQNCTPGVGIVKPHEWQRCPICKGSGAVWDLPLFPTRTRQCHACRGLGMVARP
jgi:hypothetical protein